MSKTAEALLAEDWLRVSVQCPTTLNSGLLEAIDENLGGSRSKISARYHDGNLNSIVASHAQDGSSFENWLTLDRATSLGTDSEGLFSAFEQDANELIRLFCFADAASKDRYRELLRLNRERLEAARAE